MTPDRNGSPWTLRSMMKAGSVERHGARQHNCKHEHDHQMSCLRHRIPGHATAIAGAARYGALRPLRDGVEVSRRLRWNAMSQRSKHRANGCGTLRIQHSRSAHAADRRCSTTTRVANRSAASGTGEPAPGCRWLHPSRKQRFSQRQLRAHPNRKQRLSKRRSKAHGPAGAALAWRLAYSCCCSCCSTGRLFLSRRNRRPCARGPALP